jgi:2-keto-4-pentenoate hydratase/2-oxohepta-3-ene-1,7-dioic acid hydratase in catechol pathway
MQDTGVDDLLFDVPALIVYLSEIWPLQVGDVIATGTTGGVGAFRKPPVWMKPGDKVEVEITDLGTLTNTVIDE